MLSTPNTAPVGSPRELVNGGSAKKARYRYDEPSTRTRSGLFIYWGGVAASFFFVLSGAVTSGAGGFATGLSTVSGEFDFSVVSPGSDLGSAGGGVGRVTMSRASPGRYRGPDWPHAASASTAAHISNEWRITFTNFRPFRVSSRSRPP